jgi:CBS domain-containing protein
MDIATLAPMTIDYNSPPLTPAADGAPQHPPRAGDGRPAHGRHDHQHRPDRAAQQFGGVPGRRHLQADHGGRPGGASARIKQLQQNLAAAEASAYSTGHIVTAITDALTSRLLQLGELKLGPAPVDYAWVAAGSQARNEQTAKSDQDNCMVLDDAYDEQHGEYFKRPGRFVCDGLDACGYVYCPGEMMAMTDVAPAAQRWLQYFRGWIDSPTPRR